MDQTIKSEQLANKYLIRRLQTLRLRNRNLYIESVRYLFIAIFIYSSLRKVLSFKSYADEAIFYLQNSHVVKITALVQIIKWSLGILCLAEIAAAITLMFPKYIKVGYLFAFSSLLIIIFYLLSILQINDALSNYFGSIFPYISYSGHLIVAVVCLLLAAACLLKNK